METSYSCSLKAVGLVVGYLLISTGGWQGLSWAPLRKFKQIRGQLKWELWLFAFAVGCLGIVYSATQLWRSFVKGPNESVFVSLDPCGPWLAVFHHFQFWQCALWSLLKSTLYLNYAEAGFCGVFHNVLSDLSALYFTLLCLSSPSQLSAPSSRNWLE